MVSQNSPSVSAPAEGVCGNAVITPDEAWAFAYQANLSPDDFEEVFEDIDLLKIEESREETKQAVIAFSHDDTPDIGGEFTTSGTDKSNWLPGHDATDNTTEFLL